MNRPTRPRLLPWLGPEGQRIYLNTDRVSFIAELADDVEDSLMETGHGILRRAQSQLNGSDLSASELRLLAAILTKALEEALRVSECRGERLFAQKEEE